MNFRGLILSSTAVFALSGVMQASTVYNYAFGGSGNLGSNTHTFAPVGGSGPVINATGYQGLGSSLSAVNLYSKGVASFPAPNDESGLGLTNDRSGDNEITSCSFIMLDLAKLSGISKLGLYTESTTGGEQWKIWGSQTAPSSGQSYSSPTTGFLTGTSEGIQDISSLDSDRYIFVTSTRGNILLGGFTATESSSAATPEPASAGLLGLALVAAGLVSRRRLSKKTA